MKETYYFQHDYNARNDPKLQRLLMKLGVAGLGLYWCIIEQLYEQGGKLPISDIEVIAFNLHIEKTTIDEVVFELNLFNSDDTFFWSERVLRRLEERDRIKTIQSQRGSKGGAPKGNKNACKSKGNETNGHKENNPGQLKTTQNNPEVVLEQPENKPIRKGKERKENTSSLRSEESIGAKRTAFAPPSLQQVQAYISEKGYAVDAEHFIDFYESKGWMIGKNKMKDWQAAVRTWSRKDFNPQSHHDTNSTNASHRRQGHLLATDEAKAYDTTF